MKNSVIRAIFIGLAITLVFLICYVNVDFYLKDFNGKFEVYKSDSSGEIVSLEKRDMYFFIGKKGEAVELDKSVDKSDLDSLTEILNKFEAKLIFSEEIEEGVSYYAYTDKIRYEEMVKGERVNLHVFIAKEKIKLGTPLIYGSF